MRHLLVILPVIVGCYSPSFRDCEISCATSQACPNGLACDGTACRLPGMTGACGVIDDDAGIDTTSARLPLDMLADAQLAALCEYWVRCGVFEDAPTCERVAANVGSLASLADVRAAVNDGTVVYHEDKALECIAGFATLSCNRDAFMNDRELPLACVEVFTGLLADNTTCGVHEECTSGQCTLDTCTEDCCQGTCVPGNPPGERMLGETCTSRDRCIDSYCAPSNPTNVCAAYTPDSQPCSSQDECRPGSTCRGAANQSCRPLVPEGSTCAATDDCERLSNICFNGICTPGGLTGAQCGTTSTGDCQLLHPCSNGMCTLPPPLNQSCADSGVCSEGYCSPQQVCEPRLANGTTCDPTRSGNECESRYCDATNSVCAAEPVCF